jgi:anti-sigma regulatory factor (Ser/Thr protein kinase)
MPDFDPQDIATLPEGGFGWGLIVNQMDHVKYRREGRRNHLAIIKDLRLL